jgi:hypothetical protein
MLSKRGNKIYYITDNVVEEILPEIDKYSITICTNGDIFYANFTPNTTYYMCDSHMIMIYHYNIYTRRLKIITIVIHQFEYDTLFIYNYKYGEIRSRISLKTSKLEYNLCLYGKILVISDSIAIDIINCKWIPMIEVSKNIYNFVCVYPEKIQLIYRKKPDTIFKFT